MSLQYSLCTLHCDQIGKSCMNIIVGHNTPTPCSSQWSHTSTTQINCTCSVLYASIVRCMCSVLYKQCLSSSFYDQTWQWWSLLLSCDLTAMCVCVCVCFPVTAVARLDSPAGGDWSGYNCRVILSCGLQHRCDEHSSTCKADGILYTEGSLNFVAETSDQLGGGGKQSMCAIEGGMCVCVCV